MIHTKITESTIEQFAIEFLEKSGYQYVYGPDIAPDSVTPERQSFEDVLLIERLTAPWPASIRMSLQMHEKTRQLTGQSRIYLGHS